MNRSSWAWLLCAMLANVSVCSAQEKVIAPDLSQVNNGRLWNVINADCRTALEDGKRVVRLRPKGRANTPSDIGLALVEGLEFGEGTLEIDLKGKGAAETSFLGVAFSAVDGKTFEAVYFRPFNFMRNDQAFRVRAVQYVAWPDHTWEKLRKGNPGVYESAVKPVPDPGGWFHAHRRDEAKGERVGRRCDAALLGCRSPQWPREGKGRIVGGQQGGSVQQSENRTGQVSRNRLVIRNRQAVNSHSTVR